MGLLDSIQRDIRVALERDPAARNAWEVVLAYPGFHALQSHRLAHALWEAGVPVLPRVVSHLGRFLTGIEIHPGAELGEGLFIDHGMGVVIGETSVIGEDCTLFQGVTLGGTSRQRTKRHPTLGRNVSVGTGARLIGDIHIGDNVKVGAGSVVVTDVPDNATVVGVPGRVVAVSEPSQATKEHLPDPVWDLFQSLLQRVAVLEARLASLEGRPSPGAEERESMAASHKQEGVA